MHAHRCPDFDMGEVKPGDPAMGFCMCDPISPEQAALADKPCAHKGTICCEPGEHHWRPDCDDDNGAPHMQCGHCDARRPYTDDDAVI